MRLGVNVDHVATVRQARGGSEPDPVAAAVLAELGGADQITIHLREDRRHIQDRDVRILRDTVATRLNLEMAATEEILGIACDVRPDEATLVRERREELTTEVGLDVAGEPDAVRRAIERLHDAGIAVSLFIDPHEAQIEASAKAGADAVELHTGCYANAATDSEIAAAVLGLARAAESAARHGLVVNAGHGLTYTNVVPVIKLPEVEELNIGHCIVSRAVLVGMERAVREMKGLITTHRP